MSGTFLLVEIGPQQPVGPISIQLTAPQIDTVVRAAVNAKRLAIAGTGLADASILLQIKKELPSDASKALAAGLLLFARFPTDGTALGVTQLADELEIPASTVHPYLKTLVVLGLIEQVPRSRKYRIAP